jgi:hypothetical protein
VNKAFQYLEKAGVIERLSEGPRNRVWEAAGLLDLLARLEMGELPQDRKLDELVAQITPSNRHKELTTGVRKGKEIR